MDGLYKRLDLNIQRLQTSLFKSRQKINLRFQSQKKRFRKSPKYKRVRVLYQDEAGFGRMNRPRRC